MLLVTAQHYYKLLESRSKKFLDYEDLWCWVSLKQFGDVAPCSSNMFQIIHSLLILQLDERGKRNDPKLDFQVLDFRLIESRSRSLALGVWEDHGNLWGLD